MAIDKEAQRLRWLAISAKTGKIDKLKELLDEGLDVNARDGSWTALMYAAACGHLEYVAEIVRLGADVSLVSREGKSALHYADEAGHAAIVDFLLENGGRDERLQAERELLASIAAGLDVDARDEYGATLLMRAVDQNRERVVERLLARGADVHAATRFGHTALMLAVYWGRAGIAERLIKAGARLPHEPVLMPSAETLEASGMAELIDQFAPPEGATSAQLWERRVRVDPSEFSLADLERQPFWETCADEDDQDHILRPVPFIEPLDHEAMGEVRVELTLADGSRYPGYAQFDGFNTTYTPEQFAQSTKPSLALEQEWIHFYSGTIVPTREGMDAAYKKLGKEPLQVFPIRVRSAVELKDMPREGLLEGFAWYARETPGPRVVRIVR